MIECERKWVLKNHFVFSNKIYPEETIEIFYAYDGNTRFTKKAYSDGSVKYEKVIKKGTGIAREEKIEDLTEKEFLKKYHNPHTKKLKKARYIYEIGEYKAEVDVYDGMWLVTMEVEKIFVEDDPQLDKKIEKFKNKKFSFPQIIKDNIIEEVTDLKGFGNINLAS